MKNQKPKKPGRPRGAEQLAHSSALTCVGRQQTHGSGLLLQAPPCRHGASSQRTLGPAEMSKGSGDLCDARCQSSRGS